MIRLVNVSRQYPAQEDGGGVIKALDAVSLHVEQGEWLAMMGPSGSGKSTLVNLIGCLDRPSAGQIWLDGENVAEVSGSELNRMRAEKIGFVFQQFHLIPYLTALENVMLAQYLHSMADAAEARRALERVGLGDRVDHRPGQLSGGEQQRVCVARALINHPKLILADEPTGNLDEKNAALVLGLFTKLHNEGHTIVMVTHAPEIARMANRRFELRHGSVKTESRSTKEEEELFDDVLQQLWERVEAGSDPNVCADGPSLLENRSLLMSMERLQLVVPDRGGFQLSEKGKLRAKDIIRRHRLAECLFRDTFEIRSNEQIESNACVLEHVLSPEVTESICKFLKHPPQCPHGRPIPRGPCCEHSGQFRVVGAG
jgi:putative ABC transport system ATP-binding protein